MNGDCHDELPRWETFWKDLKLVEELMNEDEGDLTPSVPSNTTTCSKSQQAFFASGVWDDYSQRGD